VRVLGLLLLLLDSGSRAKADDDVSTATSRRWMRAGIGVGEPTAKAKIMSLISWGRAWRRLLGCD
jgi:hypothetical protein